MKKNIISKYELIHTAISLASSYLKSDWWSEQVPSDWKRGHITCTFKKGKQEDPGIYPRAQ